MRIHLLEPLTANQIAAGEVIERPASVVKEILENSIDAGASKIDLEIEKGGSQLIRLTDNGYGIHKDDLQLALSRHGTSKIQTVDDLSRINTLGFRGEALASIAAIARVTLSTCFKDQTTAWKITMAGIDTLTELAPVAHPQGTTLEVRELFFNTPARRKFLRTEKTEFSHIEEVVRRVALSHFAIRITLQHNQRKVFMLPAATTKKTQEQRVSKLCGKSFIDNVLDVSFASEYIKLSGWIAPSSFPHTNTNLQYFYVNGRIIRDKLINHAIRQAYQDLLSHNQHPAYVLYLTIDPAAVDVNVHPTKHEVRFCEARLIHDFIFRSIQKALHEEQNEISTVIPDLTLQDEEHQVNETQKQGLEISCQLPADEAQSYASMRDLQVEHVSYASKANILHMSNPTSIQETINAYEILHKPTAKVTDIKLKTSSLGDVIAQLHNQYILAQNIQGLVLVEITKAQKALLYTQFKNAYIAEKLHSQPLLIPITLNVTIAEMNYLEKHMELFAKIGIELQPIAPDTLLVRKLPSLLSKVEIARMLTMTIRACGQKKITSASEEEMNILLQLLVDNGVDVQVREWTHTEMNGLLEKLEHHYDNVKHGPYHPVWVELCMDELIKLFS